MPRLLPTAIALIALSLLTTAQAGAAPFRSGHPKCESKRQHFRVLSNKRFRVKHPVPFLTVAANSQVRVYRSTINAVERRFYICSQSTGRSRFIARDPSDSGAAVTDYGLDLLSVTPSTTEEAPSFVALRTFARGDVNYDRFVVFNATGKRVHDTGKLALAEFDLNDRTGLALAANGAMAYEHLGVLSATDTAGTRVLSAPAGGLVDGVASVGQTVYWAQGETAHSATLG
jgi:hypothetical protein